jgi:hypothetical protein
MPAASNIMKQNTTKSTSADTPPNSPTLPPSQDITMSHLVQRFVEAVESIVAAKALSDPSPFLETADATVIGHAEQGETRARASRLSYKKVDEV